MREVLSRHVVRDFRYDPAEITYVENPWSVEEMQDLLLK